VIVGIVGVVRSFAPHAGKPGTYHLIVDGQEPLDVHEDVIVALELRVGLEVTPQLWQAILAQQELAQVRRGALRLLEVRSRSRRDLRTALIKRKHRAEAVEQVLDQLENLGLLNDDAYARNLAEGLMRRQGVGRRGLKHKLMQGGVSQELAKSVVEEAFEGVDEVQQALTALEKRLGRWTNLPVEKRRMRAYAYLARLGFGGDVISDALHRALADE
jgi:regulatory protein